MVTHAPNTTERAPAPIPVKPTYYPLRCEKCGWQGSSEQCGLVRYVDDADITCPSCERIICGEEIEATW